MAGGWQETKAQKSDVYDPHVIELLQRTLCPIALASYREDAFEGTDLRAFVATRRFGDNVRIAERVRSRSYWDRFPGEVTFRWSRPSGNVTEWKKLMSDGWGDVFFYGFGDEETSRITEYVILDLSEFRFANATGELDRAFTKLPNGDRSSDFVAFSLEAVPASVRDRLVLAASPGYQDILSERTWTKLVDRPFNPNDHVSACPF